MPTPPRPARNPNRSPAAVAVAAWVLPGAGYWLLGERTRALTIGITVILLFVAGLLVAGVRVLEVPGFGPHGQRLEVIWYKDRQGGVLRESVTEDTGGDGSDRGWVMVFHPLDEIRNKPWSIAQIMTGPVGLIAGAGSVAASERPFPDGPPRGVRSHAHVNEIGVLYTAVAGMLNLLAIIDSSHRAGQESRG